MSLRVVFFGNAGNVFSRRFYEALTQTPAKVVAVVDTPDQRRASTNAAAATGPGDFAAEARRRGIAVLDPADPNKSEVVRTLAELRPELFLAVGYLYRLKADLLGVPRLLAANVHASLLPAYRGRSPVFWALRHGEAYSGLTVHAMDAGLDSGDLLYQVRVATRPDDTVATLYDRIIADSLPVVAKLIRDAESGQLPRTPQPREGGSYFSAPKESDYRLDWSRPARELCRWVMATPGECFADVAGQRVYFVDARAEPGAVTAPPGTLLAVGDAGCTVSTGEGSLILHAVQVEKERTTFAEYCRRVGLGPGARLNDA